MKKVRNKCLSKRNIKHEKNRRKESWKIKYFQVIRKKVFLHIRNADSDGDVGIEIIQNMHAFLSDNLVISVFNVPEKGMYLKIPSHLCVNNKYNCNAMNILVKNRFLSNNKTVPSYHIKSKCRFLSKSGLSRVAKL